MKESQNIEWKGSWRDDHLRWICGFANAEGGVIHIGRDDSGKVAGVADVERLLEEIPNKVRDILGILVDVNLGQEEGVDYIEIITEPYPYPVSCRGRYYYRSGSTKQELTGGALDRFLLRKQGRHWDGVPVPGVSSTELSVPRNYQIRRSISSANWPGRPVAWRRATSRRRTRSSSRSCTLKTETISSGRRCCCFIRIPSDL